MEDWQRRLREIITVEKTPCCTEATTKTRSSVEIAEMAWLQQVRKAFDNLAAKLMDVAVVNHVESEWMQSLHVNMKGHEGGPEVLLEYTIKVSIVGRVSKRERRFRCADGKSAERCFDTEVPNTWAVADIIADIAQSVENLDG